MKKSLLLFLLISVLGMLFVCAGMSERSSVAFSEGSSQPVAQVPINITNTEAVAMPNPFQVRVQVNSQENAAYEAADLSNIAFSYTNGTLIPSWLESGDSNTSTTTIYWLKIGGLPARSSMTVLMNFYPITDSVLNNITTGKAPQLSPIYGEYDDGSSVFSVYNNFSGTTLDSHISTISGALIEQADGLQITHISAVGSTFYLMTSYYSTSPFIYDAYVTAQNQANSSNFQEGLVIDSNSPNSWNSGGVPGGTCYFFRTISGTPGSSTLQIWENGTQLSSINAPASTPYTSIESFQQGQDELVASDNYQTTSIATNDLTTGYLGFYEYSGDIGSYSQNQVFVQWLRIRAFPPNGVAPSVAVGNLVVVSEFSTIIMLPLFWLATLLLVVVHRKIHGLFHND